MIYCSYKLRYESPPGRKSPVLPASRGVSDCLVLITGTLLETFYCLNQAGALIVCLERYYSIHPHRA